MYPRITEWAQSGLRTVNRTGKRSYWPLDITTEYSIERNCRSLEGREIEAITIVPHAITNSVSRLEEHSAIILTTGNTG